MKKQGKTMPSNFQIFDYWKDKFLSDNEAVIWDWGEPSCWACNKIIRTETEELLNAGDYKAIWNLTSGHLERCHILAKALDGSNKEENLFLMCPSCHAESPNVINKEMFIDWAINRRRTFFMGLNTDQFLGELHSLCSKHNVDAEEFAEFVKELDQETIYPKVNTHGFQMNQSTLLYAWMDEYINSSRTSSK